jgi:cell division protein FtsQ
VDRIAGERRRKLARILRLCLPTAVALALLGTAGTLGYERAIAGGAFRVKEIRFHGLSRVHPEELLGILPVRRGDHLLLVDPEVAEAALLRHPWVARAEVRRRLPPALDVDVVERRAVALVDMGGLYLVDPRGEVFKRAQPGDGLDLPVVTGIERDAWTGRRSEVEPLLAGALALVGAWAEGHLDGAEPISEIHVDPDYGTTVTTADGTEIRLGQRDLVAKLSRLSRLLPALQAEGRKAEVIHLDNRRHPEWVAVRFAGTGDAGLIGAAGKGVR